MSIYHDRQVLNERSPDAGVYQKTPGKGLYALLMELDAGLRLYPATNHDVTVWKEHGLYHFQRLDPRNGGTELEDSRQLSPEGLSYAHVLPRDRPISGQLLQVITMKYDSLADLLTDWPLLAWRAVWSTQQTEERLAWRPQVFTL